MIFKRFKTEFAHNIFHNKYAQGQTDTWDQLADRLVNDVCGDRSLCAKPNTSPLMSKSDQDQLAEYIKEMKFIPGGRYLYYCFDPNEQILKADYTWDKAINIKEGDELIGFDEVIKNSRFKNTKVTFTAITSKPKYKIHTTLGSVVVSGDHQFVAKEKLISKKPKDAYKWIKATDLDLGNVIAFSSQPWEVDTSYDAGWLAGFMDGEGTVSKGSISISQKPGLALDNAIRILTEKNINFYVSHRGVDSVRTIHIRGRWESVKVLGMFRPQRLLANWYSNELGCFWSRINPPAIITKIEFLGVGDVCVIETDTHTLIGNGFLSHNCGRPISFYNNCFSGDTKLLTPNGMETFKSLVGQEIQVYSPVSKQFEYAVMHEHGYQKLNKITFVPVRGTSKIKWSVRATRTHHWPLIDGTDTYDIRIGDVVPAAYVELDILPHAYIHGLFFADGGYSGNDKRFKMRLCGKKKEWLQYILDHSKNSKVTYPDSANGEPYVYVSSDVNLKELPNTDDPEYIASFLRGWANFDGHHGECRRINSINEKAIDMFVEYAHYAGYIVTGTKSFTDKPSNFGERINKLFHVQFIYAQDFNGFKVESIVPDGEEKVYCPREPKYERIVINYGIDTYQCFALKAEEDTREEWGNIVKRASDCLMSGGGIGVDYSLLRPSGRTLSRTGGISSGPLPLMSSVNEIGRNVMQGGSRRSAIYASLNWQHEDIEMFLNAKDWSDTIKKLKAEDFNFPAPFDMTNMSINWDTDFIESVTNYEIDGTFINKNIPDLWYKSVLKMCQTGEPGHSYNFWENENDTLRNACTEFTSEDDSDVCNLGSINLGNISNLEELKAVVSLAAKFLVCGSIRGDLPYDKVKQVRETNRKIGLGLMGVHEWLIKKGYQYEMVEELKEWLDVYKTESESAANEWSDRFFINRPKKYRAIAPAGTIGILASTTTGIEPMYAVAYKRRYLHNGTKWKYEYVIDATARELIESYGVDPQKIETSNALAVDPERRIRFQYEIQKYVDMAISSTINLPAWGSKHNNEHTSKSLADILLRYCHGLRGITVYPDGSRGGQPLTEVDYYDAIKHPGVIFDETEEKCKGGVCGL